jgi:hypothetical protein
VLAEQRVVGWQCWSWQKLGGADARAQSPSTRQRGDSWQIGCAQGKPGGQVACVKGAQVWFAGHCALSVQDW